MVCANILESRRKLPCNVLSSRVWAIMASRRLLTPVYSLGSIRVGEIVQSIACCLFDAKSLSEPMLISCELYRWKQMPVTFESKYNHFLQENDFANVVRAMATILSFRAHWTFTCSFHFLDQATCPVKANWTSEYFFKRLRVPRSKCY